MIPLIVNVPDDGNNTILDAYVFKFGYSDTITDGQGQTVPNPETKPDFMVRMLLQHIERATIAYEQEQSVTQALNSARDQILAIFGKQA